MKCVDEATGMRMKARGFTLVELMIAMVLGLVVIGGVTSVFLSNKQSYRTNQALSEIQDSSRIAFEFLARDIREAGLTGCGNTGRVANVLKLGPVAGGTAWWANWGNAVVGYEGGTGDPALANISNHVAGTDSIELIGADGTGLTVQSHDPNAAQFKVNETTTAVQNGDVIIVCSPDHATILQVHKSPTNNTTLEYSTGASVSPGNCSKGLGFPTQCTTNGNNTPFDPNARIATVSAADWYIGTNAVGGRSLYRVNVAPDAGGTIQEIPQEMVRNVTDMQITYLDNPNNSAIKFVKADGVANWSDVTAVRVTLTLQSTDQQAGTDAKPLQRTYTATTTIRNRVQ